MSATQALPAPSLRPWPSSGLARLPRASPAPALPPPPLPHPHPASCWCAGPRGSVRVPPAARAASPRGAEARGGTSGCVRPQSQQPPPPSQHLPKPKGDAALKMRASLRMTRYLESWGAQRPFAHLNHRESVSSSETPVPSGRRPKVGPSSRELGTGMPLAGRSRACAKASSAALTFSTCEMGAVPALLPPGDVKARGGCARAAGLSPPPRSPAESSLVQGWSHTLPVCPRQ